MKTEQLFPPGFQVFTRDVKHREAMSRSEPVCTIGKSGFLIFSLIVSNWLLGSQLKNKAVFMAWNLRTKLLALRPVPWHEGAPITYKLILAKLSRGVIAVSFRTQAKAWGFDLEKTRTYACRQDKSTGIVYVDLNSLVKEKG